MHKAQLEAPTSSITRYKSEFCISLIKEFPFYTNIYNLVTEAYNHVSSYLHRIFKLQEHSCDLTAIQFLPKSQLNGTGTKIDRELCVDFHRN